MRKKRILMVGEHNIAKSGFGLYTREILSRLHKSNKYEIAELSCFNNGEQPSNVPWKVYPNAPSSSEPKEAMQQYTADPGNVFGKWRFDQVCLDFRPDIVFDIRDFWMLEYQETSLLRPYFHWVIAPTVDSLPQQLSWLQTFSNADVVLAHTDWAIDYMKNDVGHNINAVTSVSDSVDTDIFCPINYSSTLNRAQHFIPKDSFVVGAVMRNQKRKLIPNLMGIIKQLRAFSKRTDAFLYLHTSFPERNGWDIPSLLQEYEAYNFVLFTYYCDACKKPFASLWKGHKTPCPFCKSAASFPSVANGLTDHQLKNIYNLFDVYVQYAICEGLGIPQLEAASCGVPICSVDYSAMSEVTTKLEADKISYALYKELETGAFRAVPNDSETMSILLRHMNDSPESKKQKKNKIRSKILENYSWDKTAEKYIEIFDNLKPKNIWDKPLSTNPGYKVNSNVNHRQFVTDVVTNIIQSPHILKSTFIQNMIRQLDEGYTQSGTNIVRFNVEMAKKNLEALLNHKVLLEKLRSKEAKDNSKFLKYGQ